MLAAAVIVTVAAIGTGAAIVATRGHDASVTANAPTTVATTPRPKVAFAMRVVQGNSPKRPCPGGLVPDIKPSLGCYQLGPVLLDNSDIVSASASSDDVGGWGLDVTMTGTRYPAVMRDNAGRHVALLINGEVVSAPMVNPGITGREMRISGNFDEQTAKRLASELNPPGATTSQEPACTNSDLQGTGARLSPRQLLATVPTFWDRHVHLSPAPRGVQPKIGLARAVTALGPERYRSAHYTVLLAEWRSDGSIEANKPRHEPVLAWVIVGTHVPIQPFHSPTTTTPAPPCYFGTTLQAVDATTGQTIADLSEYDG
jgi:hypothetical protein